MEKDPSVKLATLRTATGTTAARLVEGALVLLPYPDVGAVLAANGLNDAGVAHGEMIDPGASVFAPLIPQPSKIFCQGLNYRTHIREMGEALPPFPTLFGKFPDTLIGAGDDVLIPAVSSKPDWEAELVAVIGAVTREASPAKAAGAIAGFTVGNDVSLRDLQGRTSQWLQGKCAEQTAPVGPYLVTVDEVGVQPDLRITCAVNGVTKQDARTSDLLFSVAELVSYISGFTTLRPGDLIFTGTPGGVGQGRSPQEYLQDGDMLETEIEGIGATHNLCRRAAP